MHMYTYNTCMHTLTHTRIYCIYYLNIHFYLNHTTFINIKFNIKKRVKTKMV